jgi:2-dehydro-3-deoxyphosphooctonate aldolase (KDO 8-P synthase)
MTIIAGPCQHENLQDSYDIAEHCQNICNEFGINYIFKASFDKANRTYIDSPRGLGLKECKADFDKLREGFKLTTDFHQTNQVEELEVDVVQIPALLCKQTDLLLSAKKTGSIINIKKGQFVPPGGIKGILSKVGTDDVWITERGHSFGYDNVIIDFEGIQYMQDNYNVPIFLDITHSISDRKYALTMARLAGTMGLNLFVEVHNDPDNAPSDGSKSIYLKDFKELVKQYYDCRKNLG